MRPPLQPWVPRAPTPPRGGSRTPAPSELEAVEAVEAEEEIDAELAHAPIVPPAADLARPAVPLSWVVICFCLSLLVYLAMVPRIILYSNPPTGDQAFYLMVIASIVQDGDLNIANNYAQRDEDKFYTLSPRPPGYVGMGGPYPLPMAPTDSSARPPQERYDHRMPGLPLLLAPAWLAGSWVNLWWPATVIAMCIFGATLATNIFLFAYELTGRKWIAWAVWLPAAFSNPIMTYVLLIFTEVVTGLLIIYAVRRLALGWAANGPRRMLLVGLCVGYIPWMSWRNFPISLTLGAYGLYQFWRYAKAKTGPGAPASEREQGGPGVVGRLASAIRRQAVPLTMWLLPMLLAAGLLAVWNLFLYASLTPPSRVPELGNSPPFIWPWQGGEQFARWVTVGFALLLDRQTGLLIYAPFYLLSLIGIIAMVRSRRRSDRRLLFWIAAISLPYVAIIMSFVFWSGLWGPPARYMSAVVPLLCGPLAVSLLALERSTVYKVLYCALALPGPAIMAIMMSDARYLWPANSVFLWLRDNPASPLRNLNIDLWNSFPSIEHLDPVRLPGNTAWMTVAGILIVLGSFLLMLLQRPRWTDKALPTALQGLIALGVVGLVGGGWYLMNAEYLKPRTLLAQQQRWRIDVETGGLQGMAYLDNKLFFADFSRSFLGALDLPSGAFSIVQPVGASEAVSITSPTDVAVGPDNLLYVLNNGQGTPGVLVLKSDGTVVSAIPLAGRSTIASGIAVGADGSIWVADTVGGRAIKYGPDGGDPIFDLPGRKFNCVNIIDVAVLEDGSVFITDQTLRVIQVGPDGELMNTYKTQFHPWYLATNGDWLDVTHDQGMTSVNLKTKQTQQSRVVEPGEQLGAPRGIAYGPDGTLYVLDAFTRTITAYQAQR